MKLQLFLTCCLCIFFLNVSSSQEMQWRIIDDVAAIIAKGDKMSTDRLAAELSTTIARKYKLKPLKEPLVEAIETLISFRRSQRLSGELKGYAYELNDHLIAGIITNLDGQPPKESKRCTDAKDLLKRKLGSITEKIKDYMDCMARNSRRKPPQSRNYDNITGRFLGAPSPPPGDIETEDNGLPSRKISIFPAPKPPKAGSGSGGSTPHPCQHPFDELEETKAFIEYLSQLVQEACE